MTDCGLDIESCCASPEVKGGVYYRAYENDGGGPTYEGYPATVSSFALDKYDVTVGRFRQFVSAWSDGYLPPKESGKHTHLNGGKGLANSGKPGTYERGWEAANWNPNVAPTDANLSSCELSSTWTPSVSTRENLPINCVNWYEAYAFCIWDDGFLPSEAEWGYAGAGGDQEREYPWGSTDPGSSSEYAIYNCYFKHSSGPYCTGTVTDVAPVGIARRGAGAWGQLDLAGNVLQWNLDWYASYVDPCADCAYLNPASFRTDRGGAFNSAATIFANASVGVNSPPTVREYILGFRCARSAP
jgi:sulfatase modifying factor 1